MSYIMYYIGKMKGMHYIILNYINYDLICDKGDILN